VAAVLVNTPGELAARGETVVELIPAGVALELEIQIPHRDVGKVRVGQEVRYKFDAFPFGRHGVLRGTIERVSPAARPAEVAGEQSYYRAYGDLDQDYFRVEGGRVPLLPGMTALAEIKTEERRVLAVMFEPLRELTSPASAER